MTSEEARAQAGGEHQRKGRLVLGICGSPKKNEFSSSAFLLEQALAAAQENGASTMQVRLADFDIRPCTGCGACMANARCPLLADPADRLSELYELCLRADAFVFASPVYALGLPAMWKNWIDRCEPCSDDDLAYDHYCYDTAQFVKGKAFRGKVAGQIVVAAGPGHEWAMASLMPAFTAVRLSMVASAGISLIEYDAQPAVRRQPWARDLRGATFAIDMARAVGRRVHEAIGFTTFVPLASPQQGPARGPAACDLAAGPRIVEDAGEVRIGDLPGEFVCMVVGTKETAWEARRWVDALLRASKVRPTFSVAYLAAIERLPFFVPRAAARGEVMRAFGHVPCLLDWDRAFCTRNGIPCWSSPTIVLIEARTRAILLAQPLAFSDRAVRFVVDHVEPERATSLAANDQTS